MSTINDAFAKATDSSGHEHGSDGKFTSKGGKSYKTSEKGGQTHMHDEKGRHIGYVRPAGSNEKGLSGKGDGTGYRAARDLGMHGGAHFRVGDIHATKDHAMHALANKHEHQESKERARVQEYFRQHGTPGHETRIGSKPGRVPLRDQK